MARLVLILGFWTAVWFVASRLRTFSNRAVSISEARSPVHCGLDQFSRQVARGISYILYFALILVLVFGAVILAHDLS